MCGVSETEAKTCSCKGEDKPHQPKHGDCGCHSGEAKAKTCTCKGEDKPHQPEHGDCGCHSSSSSAKQCGCKDSNNEQPLNQSKLDKLVSRIADKADYQKGLACFKKHNPGIRVIECSEDDMAEREPFLAASYFDIFLMANGTSCARLTNSLDLAIGLVIALHEED